MSTSTSTSTSTPSEMEQFPIIHLKAFLEHQPESKDDSWVQDCKQISRLLHQYGILVVRDPRVSEEDNSAFIDLMEQYYEQKEEERVADIRKELYYQVGVTPSGIEKARDHCDKMKHLVGDNKPLTECPPEVDPKSRFFWRMGERPEKTEFTQLNAEPVIPKAFPHWPNVMNKWGGLMLNAVHTVAEMAALGMDLERDTFTKLMKFGPHLLAPTGSDLAKWGKLGTVFASYHYDLNFLTIHGRSRFPGLYVWTRDGTKMTVKVPPGCLLLQAGKQFEYLTGGEILAGFHEVVVSPATLVAVEQATQNQKSLWRISSTLFGHIASDQILAPTGKFATEEATLKYPPIKAGHQVQAELDSIKLGKDDIVVSMA